MSLDTKFDPISPHQFLGLHTQKEKKVIRFFIPQQKQGEISLKGEILQANHVQDGLFFLEVDKNISPFDYQIIYPFGKIYDPYVFSSCLKENDFYRIRLGIHYELYNVMGAHFCVQDDIEGYCFTLFAPHAKKVCLIGDFNHWDMSVFPMQKRKEGVWELFLPIDCNEHRYQYAIYTQDEQILTKSDPFARSFEVRPSNASIAMQKSTYQFKDSLWQQKQKNSLKNPINIYEVHLGSWKNLGAEFPNYKDLAKELVPYCREMGFTHVELLPIMEHPLDESWGYQVTGYFAPTSRYGSVEDFKYFVDLLHQNQIGVILDWVPAHFPVDEFSLIRFDGSHLYEYDDPMMRSHPSWSSAIFDYGSYFVTNFLIASALFWLKEMKIDGLRVDAVASVLFLDFGREKNDWKPNKLGTNINLEGREFLKHLNQTIKQEVPSALVFAEESSTYEGITRPVKKNGLGFDVKWKMGWMNDTLRFFSTNMKYRKIKMKALTFSMHYAYEEKFILALSHDEVVHEKRSLINKLEAGEWVQFANLRLLYSYMLCHPGKNLIFMGAEIAQRNEWSSKKEINWHLLEEPMHQKMKDFVRHANHFYLQNEPLWELDFSEEGFEWVYVNEEKAILSFIRKSKKKKLFCIHHCVDEEKMNYLIPFSQAKEMKEVFNSDETRFGGTNRLNPVVEKKEEGFCVNLPSLATLIFEISDEK